MSDDADSDSLPEQPADEGEPQGQAGNDEDTKHDDDRAGRERGDQFTEAEGDPLADALGGTAGRAEEGQARRSWIRTVRASGAAAFVGGGHIGVLNISTAADSPARLTQVPGPVDRDLLSRLTGRYAPVAGYDSFLTRLMTTRLLVLRGAPGTGRTTTGLQLLTEVAEDVARFAPATDLRSLPDDAFAPEFGYLLELIPGEGPPPPSAAAVDQLRDQLMSKECYLVVIAPHDVRHRDGLDAYTVDCPLPEPRRVLDRAVEQEGRTRPSLESALRQAVADAPLDAGCTPAEVNWIVTELATGPVEQVTSGELVRLSGAALSRYVSGWFEPLANLPATSEADERVRLAGFRIALAVFNDLPFDLVAEAGEDLTRRILKARSPRRTPGRPVFSSHREDYVANSRAHLKPGTVRFVEASTPAMFIAYDDDRLATAILGYVWSVHNVRGPLVSWLRSLSADLRPMVRTRAALAIGLLSSWDFSYTFHEWIEPWARAVGEDSGRRWVAAVALDEASRNDQVRPVVREIVEAWCRKGTFAQRWTGAMALSYDLGLRDPAKALRELRKLGCGEDGRLARIASWAIGSLFAQGAIEPVLESLRIWLFDDRLAVRKLGQLAVLRIANMKVSNLDDPELTSQMARRNWARLADRDRWPLLVALAEEEPELLDPFADLIWQLTRSARALQPISGALAKWMRAGEKDRTCIGPVGHFLALLGDDMTDRSRLLHLVGVLRRDQDEPLPADIADYYMRAIEKNQHAWDEAG